MLTGLLTAVAVQALQEAASDALALQALTAKNLGNHEVAAAFEAASQMVKTQ